MANTMFRASSKVQQVNWGILIYEIVARAIPYKGRKPSYLFPFILHLYKHYECITIDEDDLLTIAAEEVAYKLHPAVAYTKYVQGPHRTGSTSILTWEPSSKFPETQLSTTSPSTSSSGSQTQSDTTWRNVDLSAWDFLEIPFKRLHDELAEL